MRLGGPLLLIVEPSEQVVVNVHQVDLTCTSAGCGGKLGVDFTHTSISCVHSPAQSKCGGASGVSSKDTHLLT